MPDPVLLTDAEVSALADVVERMKGDVPATVERIAQARMAEAWAEGVEFGRERSTWPYSTVVQANPYRVDA